jgi:hypothetical protein
MLTNYKMSSTTTIATTSIAITTIIIANYNITLIFPPLLLLALLANPTRAIVALSRLPPLRVPILQTSYTINYAWPINLKAELSQITSQVYIIICTYYTSKSGIWVLYVVIASFFNRSYFNCYYSNKGTRYSFYKYL